jgi:hypothetical protein
VLHSGYRDTGHVFVTFELDLPTGDGPGPAMRREIIARDLSLALAAHLVGTVPAFREATLGSASFELSGPHTGRLLGPATNPFAGPIVGLWCLTEAARLPEPELFHNPVAAAGLGEAAAAKITPRKGRREQAEDWLKLSPPEPASLELRELESPQPSRQYKRRTVAPTEIPVWQKADVLVAGGGTSGATAASTAARDGARTALLDMNPGLGGTGTMGGVNSYWYGRHVGFSHRIESLTTAVHQQLGHAKSTWNIEAKMHALLRDAVDAGVSLLWNAVTFGALVEGKRVRGVAAATR